MKKTISLLSKPFLAVAILVFSFFSNQKLAAQAGEALHFDGSNDYVNVPYDASFNAFPLTIEAWVKPNGGGEIVDRYIASSGNGYRLMLSGTNLNAWYYTPGAGGDASNPAATINCTANQWNHVAMTVTATELRFYVNGNPAGTYAPSSGGSFGAVTTTAPLSIGRFASQTSNYFNGQIDEVRIWNTARDCGQISQQKDCELPSSEGNLVAYYQFNQGLAGGDNTNPPVNTLTDLTTTLGGANDGTLNGFALTGATSNWVTPGGVTSGSSCGSVSYPEANIQGGSPLVSITDGDITPSTTDGTDHGSVLVGEPSAKTFTIQNTGTGDLTVSTITKTGTNQSEFEISGISLPATITAGSSVDFTVTFTPTATGSRTATIHVNSDDCDEADYDFAVKGTGAVAGAALAFDGTNDYISFPTTGMTAASGTISFWVNAAASQPVNSTSMVEFGGDNISIFFWNNGAQIYFRAGGIGSQSSPISYTGGSWKHVAMTWAGVGQTAKCYIDGVQVTTFTQTGAVNFGSTGYLGRSSSYANGLTNLLGSLDDVRFWNRMLCADEISALKNCEVSPSSDDLSVYFKCNQGTAGGDNTGITTLTDDATAIGGANDGSFFHFALDGATSNFIAPGGITGGACSPSIPEINLQGAGMNILDGDITPSTTDGTDHGSVLVGAPSAKTFTIQNTTGTGTLTISSISVMGTNSSEFVISGAPTSIAAGGSADFTVTFTPTATGSRTATIHVNNDDCDEADYDFAVQGTGAVAGAALSFDGTNDYVDCGNASAFNPNNIKTMETWVKFNSLTNDQDIMAKATNCTGIEMLLFGSNLAVYFMKDCSNFSYIAYPKSNLTAGQWHHIAVSWDGTKESIKMYLDGAPVGTLSHTGNINTTGLGNPANGLYLGQWGALGRPLNGMMDEARVWSRTLCQSEISAQKDCELSGSENGLVAYYKFNQGFAGGDNAGLTTLDDAAGTPQNGTLTNFALTGATSNWVAPGGVTSGNSCSPFDAPEINLQGAGNNILDGDITPSTTDGTDHGAVLVGAPSAKTFTIQNTTGTGTLTISSISVMGTNSSEFVISGAPTSIAAGGSADFTVTFTPTATGSRTATIHVNNDDCDEEDYDFAVKGTGAIAGAALDFDGSNDYVSLPGTFGGPTWTELTIEARVNVNATSGDLQAIVSATDLSFVHFQLFGAGNNVAFTNNGNVVLPIIPQTPTGQWRHVAMVIKSGDSRIFVDGVQLGATVTTTFGNILASNLVSIGRGSGGRYLNGKVDEVRIWTRALCQAEIAAQKDCELGGSENGLVAYYKFNQGLAGGDNMGLTTLDDAAGTPQNGTLTGFALTGATSNWVAPGGVTSGNSCSPFDAPDINLQGGSPLVSISDGDITPSTTDGTDHGTVMVGAPSAKTFTIQNTGAGLLTISTITLTGTNAGDFSIQNAPATVTAGGSATFDVVFTPSSAGLKTATVHVNNDDCDEADYDFAVQGTGAEPAKGLHFDGMNDYISLSNSTNLPPSSSSFTIEGWVYPETPSVLYPAIFSRNFDELQMWLQGSLHARVGGMQVNGTNVTLNTWTHVALTFDGTTARLYQNGTLNGSAPAAAPNFGGAGFVLGTTLGANTSFKGRMDEFRIWSGARTASEITAFMNTEIASMPPCLIAYYKFNQGTAGGDNSGQTTLTDIADATAENGTLNNFALTGATSNWASGATITETASTYLTNFPDINLVANGNNIADGTSTPSAANNTALGSVLNGAGKSRTFTIQNLGNEDLTVSTITFSGTNAADFSTSGISLPLTLAPNGTQNFTVTCNPSTVGAKTATINIVNNDCDEGNYDFAFSATGTTAFTFSSGSDWATAANWDVEIVPTTANMTSPRSVVIAQNCTMNGIGITFPSGTGLTVNSSKSLSLGTTSGITINSGATLTVQSTGSISQGSIDNYGTMNISGSYSAFYMTNRAAATLNVLSGGSYSCPACAETMMDASIVNNSGTLHLGTQSTWQADVTNNASGTITDGGNGAQITLGAQSTMLNNGSFVSRTAKTAGTFTNNGTFSMPATCNFTVQSGGAFTNNGNVTIVSSSQLTVQSSGAFANDGTGTVTNNGVFSVAGNFSQNGIFKGSGSFTGALFTNAASGTVRPGNSAGCITFANGLTSAGAVDIEIGGLTVCTGHDKITVTGTADITGSTFTASIIGSPSFSNGNTVTVLEATALTGTFSNVTLPPSWFINYTSSSVILSYGAVLPVELTFFEAKNEENRVRLDWQTASETNNRGFEIQRSADGFSWQKIGFEKGNGTTTDRHDYSFLDEKPLAGLNFYRLRQLDFDGKEDFSNIETVEMPGDGRGFSVFPNPISTGELTILFDEKMAGESAKIRLFNATGQLVKSINLSRTMDVSGLPSGIYSLEMGGIFKKIIVQ